MHNRRWESTQNGINSGLDTAEPFFNDEWDILREQ